MNKPESREYVEAVPGPAIVISRAEYERMQKENNAEENARRLAKFRKEHKDFFRKIDNQTSIKSEESDEMEQ